MIPKIIHYCWFGKNEKPEEIKKNIDGWSILYPDYKLKEWNEDNFDIYCTRYTAQAYEIKKYAFVSDYVRLLALYKEGGIYFDTDIEAVKRIDSHLEKSTVLMGFESQTTVMTAFMASEPNSSLFRDLLKIYDDKSFFMDDGGYDTTPNPVIITNVLLKYGLVANGIFQIIDDNIHIYPLDFFSGYDIDYQTYKVNSNTCLIHHCMGSWQKWSDRVKPKIKSIMLKTIGYKRFNYLKEKFYFRGRSKWYLH